MSGPFKMKGFSGFGNSPLHNNNKWVKKQLTKAEKLSKRAEKREKRTAEGKKAFVEAGSKWAGVEPIFGTGKYARKRAEKAKFKAMMGSRKAWKKAKKHFSSVRPFSFDMD